MTIKQILDTLVGGLSKRQKDIITQRFGINGSKPRTLAFLGSKYSITRERVRQIESAALRVLHKEAEKDGQCDQYLNRAIDHLTLLGGLRREEFLYDDLKFIFKDPTLSSSYIMLLFAIFKKPLYSAETKDSYAYWYTDTRVSKDSKAFVQKIGQFLKTKKEALIERKKFDELFIQSTKQHKVQDFVALNYLLASKKFSVNPFGDFGLVEWPEIVPKTIRDKAYLILKKRHEPMHFRDIAKEINTIKFDTKKAHPQTVHNELIKASDRFVLVGRGLYSLREFGIEPGTTREVLQRIMKKNGPMPLEKIVELVSRERVLKNNTIFLNLQNKKFFKKNNEGHYHTA